MSGTNFNKMIDDVRNFSKKVCECFPDTIYYKNWVKVVQNCNINVIKVIDGLLTKNDNIKIAEIGIGCGATTYAIAKMLNNRGEIHIFDFQESVETVKNILNKEGYTNIISHGNSYQRMDSYNFSFLDLLKSNQAFSFDYIFIDGAHTFPVDALAFFLCDLLLKNGGLIEFDDYSWTLQSHIDHNLKAYDMDCSSNFHSFAKRALEDYTEYQRKSPQIAYIVDTIIPLTNRYSEIQPKRLYKKIHQTILSSVNTMSSLPLMTNLEIQLLSSKLENAKNYLEFGAGQSTKFALSFPNINFIYSIESDFSYIKLLINDLKISDKVISGMLHILYANIGPTKDFGYPIEPPNDKYLNYTTNIWNNLPKDFDTILIDGRFRIATTLLSILYINNISTILIHDLNNRPAYHKVLEFVDILDSADSLIACKPKQTIDYKRLNQVIAENLFNCA